MISLIIFFIGVIVTNLTSYFAFHNSMKTWLIALIVFVAIVGMVAINGIVALICCKILPEKIYNSNNKFYNVSEKECRFYEKIGIKKWKDLTLELGKLNGFRKNKIEENSAEYIQRFIIECNMGFITHFISFVVSVVALFIMPIRFWLPTALPIVVTSLILNTLPIMILRYNIPRLKKMLKFIKRHEI